MLLSYYLTIGRKTTDIDLLAKHMEAEKLEIETALTQVCQVPMNDDFSLSFLSIEDLDHNHMNYPGFRAKLKVCIGKMRDIIQIDVAVGDTVDATRINWESFKYKGMPIFERGISLQVYPVESIVSEKLETIVARGSTTSRMKNFHDVLLISRKSQLISSSNFKTAIVQTFKTRKTETTLPIIFNKSDYAQLQPLWAAHLRAFSDDERSQLGLPSQLSTAVEEINDWLSNHEISGA